MENEDEAQAHLRVFQASHAVRASFRSSGSHKRSRSVADYPISVPKKAQQATQEITEEVVDPFAAKTEKASGMGQIRGMSMFKNEDDEEVKTNGADEP